jgi:hypothetical protein
MSTLTELNNYANTNLPFTDNRFSGVVLSYPQARDITATITETSFTLQRNIDIIEVIKPVEAAVTFTVDVSDVPGTTVAWDSLPVGVALVSGSGVYKLYNIDSAEIWDAVKTPTITVPTDYAGSIIYNCSIEFTQNGQRQTKGWEVGNYIPAVLMQSAFSTTIDADLIAGGVVNLVGQFILTPPPQIQVFIPDAAFTLECDYDVYATVTVPTLTGVTSIKPNVYFRDTITVIEVNETQPVYSGFNSDIKKFGTHSYRPGINTSSNLGRFLLIEADEITQDLSGEFTFECWIYVPTSGFAYNRKIFDFRGVDTGTYDDDNPLALASTLLLDIDDDTSTTDFRCFIDGSNRVTGSDHITEEEWIHVAIQRDSSDVINVWLDGTRVVNYTTTTDYTAIFQRNQPIGINCDSTGYDDEGPYLDDIRFSKIARYTTGATITVPTSAFAADNNDTLMLLHLDNNVLDDDGNLEG